MQVSIYLWNIKYSNAYYPLTWLWVFFPWLVNNLESVEKSWKEICNRADRVQPYFGSRMLTVETFWDSKGNNRYDDSEDNNNNNNVFTQSEHCLIQYILRNPEGSFKW